MQGYVLFCPIEIQIVRLAINQVSSERVCMSRALLSLSTSCSSSARSSHLPQVARRFSPSLLSRDHCTATRLLSTTDPSFFAGPPRLGFSLLVSFFSLCPFLSGSVCINADSRRHLAIMTNPDAATRAVPVPMESRSPRVEVLSLKIEKPELDDRSYRLIRLGDNKLEALLVHDPKTDKSSAAMDVHVGHLSDPKEFPGLAHALEHCLFLGIEIPIPHAG